MFGWSSGWISAFTEIGNGKKAVGGIMIIVACLFTIGAVMSVVLLKMVRARFVLNMLYHFSHIFFEHSNYPTITWWPFRLQTLCTRDRFSTAWWIWLKSDFLPWKSWILVKKQSHLCRICCFLFNFFPLFNNLQSGE